MTRQYYIIFSLLGVLLLTACSSSGSARQGPETDEKTVVHTIRYSGETLSELAQYYTGNAFQWKNLQVLRDDQPASNPDRLQVGDRVLIPAAIARRTAPPPKTYFRAASNSSKRKGTRVAAVPQDKSASKTTSARREEPSPAPPSNRSAEASSLDDEVLRDKLISGLVETPPFSPAP
ncbi:MAG: LysM peptidoglycan-binding domain-containing protein [Bdellovibrionales bacterium]|nr:LysM peptidoglycan-binding domain-containing protein [Bdellovibrionales bacterium]